MTNDNDDSKIWEYYTLTPENNHVEPRDCKPYLIALDWGFLCNVCQKEYSLEG